MFECEKSIQFVKDHEWLFSAHTNSLFLCPDMIGRLEQEFPGSQSLEELVALSRGSASDDSAVARFMSRCADLSLLSDADGPPGADCPRKPGTSDKKAYEINIMAPYIKHLASSHGIQSFVDVGAGLGYLDSAVLDLVDGASIVAIEHSSDNLDRLSSMLQGPRRVVVVPMSITDSTSAEEYGQCIPFPQPYMMYSLHSCGSLSDHMIRLFLGDPRAKVLLAVGCCYNLITSASFSFPLSSSLSCWGGARLSAFQKMAACQAPKRWQHQVEAVRASELKNYYRAAFQVVLCKAQVERKEFERLKVKVKPQCTFLEYCRLACEKLALDPISDTVILEAEQQCSAHRGTLMRFWMLKACIGQVIEALILYDRFLYLQQSLPATSTASVAIVALFSPVQSPRRYAIQASK